MSESGDYKRKVLLGLPWYSGLSIGAAIGAFGASMRENTRLRKSTVKNSLLAHSFNMLWCRALNEAKKNGLTHFAMQHGDIEPEPGWLDELIDELEAKELDVLGVAVAIKDHRGLTSIAVARDDGDPWRTHCRLSMAEIHRLPETFTSDDLGGRKLLLNTGLWVCRYGDWWPNLFFTINDRIIIGDDGNYHAQVESEDWFASRLFHEMGLKVGCTRKLRVDHRGEQPYPNYVLWGQEQFDSSHVERSILDPDLGDDWFPHKAAGWLSEAEGRELARLADGKAVLEVGSYCGRSTICLARTARNVLAVDTFDGRGTANPGDTFGVFRRNLELYGVANKVEEVRGESAAVLPHLPPVYDLAFIDGSHDYEAVKADATNAARCLRPGGLLAFHDYRNGRDADVDRAVDELIAGGAELFSRCDSLAVLKPAA